MPGNKIGGQKAAKTNKERHGEDFYKKIGQRGGLNGKGENYTGGFAAVTVGADGLTGSERAKKWGAVGGRASKRGPAKNGRDK